MSTNGGEIPPLLPHETSPIPNFTWGQLNRADFMQAVEAAYDSEAVCYDSEVVCWCQKLFKIPHGRAGKEFVFELAHEFFEGDYAEGSALEPVKAPNSREKWC